MRRTNPFQNASPQGVQSVSEKSQKHSQHTPTLTQNQPLNSSAKPPTQNNSFQPNQNSFTHYQNGQVDQDRMRNSEYEAFKQYNCSDEFISSTVEYFPSNQILQNSASVPIELTLSPMSPNVNPNDIPKIDYGEEEIPRCASNFCRAYVNPFVTFIDNGQNWICNFCKKVNQTKSYFYAPLDDNGNREDKETKTELCNGTYEFITNKQYWKKNRNPLTARYVFLIDVSLTSIKSGYLTAILESLKDAINNVNFYNGETTKIALITYDSSLHFYSLDPRNSQPQMLCVSGEDVLVPSTVDNLCVRIQDCKDKLLNVIDLIQSTFTTSSVKDSSMIFGAIEGGYELLKDEGGKMIVFSASNNLAGIPKMKSPNIKIKSVEEQYYTALDGRQLANFATSCSRSNISIDIFASAETYINVLTLNEICNFSNGNLYFYKKFNLELHYKSLFNQIRRVLSREIAWEGVLRTRFSHGMKITNFVTPVLPSESDLMIFPTYDSEQHFNVTLGFIPEQDQIVKNLTLTDNYIYIQSALLYSYGDGTRRIRIHNKCYPVTKRPLDIYLSVNSEALATTYMKRTIEAIYKTKNIGNSIIQTEALFSSFLSSVFSSQSSMKKELPENLIYLPLYILGMIKHRAFCRMEIEKKFDMDISNFLRIKIPKMSIAEAVCYLYPRIYPLHQILYDNEIGTYNEIGAIKLPEIVSLNYDSLESDGLFLIDNGYLLILYIKRQINQKLIKSLFNSDNLNDISFPITEETMFETLDEIKEKIMNIIDYIRGTKALFQNLIFVFEDTDAEMM